MDNKLLYTVLYFLNMQPEHFKYLGDEITSYLINNDYFNKKEVLITSKAKKFLVKYAHPSVTIKTNPRKIKKKI